MAEGSGHGDLAINPSCATHSRVAGAMPCCSLAAQAFTDARKLRIMPEGPAQSSSIVRVLPVLVSSSARLPGKQAVIPSRGAAYLLGCVFLI
jgi:hypothetical protein